MSIKKYTATKDNVISTALKGNLSSSARSSNMGSSDVLEIFSIFGQANSASIEKSRVLVEFPISEISADRDANRIPESGSVNFIVRIGNAVHGQTTPETYDLSAHALLRPWDEGYGLDMEEYRDAGASNWLSRSLGSTWHNTGSDFVNTGIVNYDKIPLHYTQSFTVGTEGISIDATGLVEEWIKGYKSTAIAASGGVRFHASVQPANNSFIRMHSYDGDFRRFVFTHTMSTGSTDNNTVYVLTGSDSSDIAGTITNFTASVLTHFGSRITPTVEGMKIKFLQATGGFPGNSALSQSLPVASTCTLTVSDAGGVGNGETIVLVDTAGTSHTFTANGGLTTATNNSIGINGIAAGSSAAALNTMAEKIAATVVDSTSTAYQLITASVSAAVITFTQLTGGTSGDRTNTDNMGGATLTNFQNGFGRNFYNLSSSFAGGVGAQNYGLLLKLSGTYEDSSRERSFYTKKMYSRSSHHFFERPVIEARWDKSIKDDRYYVFRSSSLAPQADNLNTIFLYNKQRNGLADIPDTGSALLVSLHPSIGAGPIDLPVAGGVSSGLATHITASKHSKGVYKAVFACSNTGSTFYDIWQKRTAEPVAATAQLAVTNAGGPAQSETFQLVDAAGTSHTFIINGGLTTTTNNAVGTSGLAGGTGAAALNAMAQKIAATVVDGTSTCNATITASVSAANITFSQITKGTSGNQDNASSMGGITLANFANGTDNVYTAFVTGSGFTLKDLSAGFYFEDPKYNIKITNLKPAYSADEKVTFRVYMRNKNWQPNIYTVASNTPPVHFFRNGYYRIDRVADNYNVIAYSTGSTPSYSSLSYDVSGSFFDLDMSILEPNYLYQMSFLQKDGNNYIEQKEKFKFRVDP